MVRKLFCTLREIVSALREIVSALREIVSALREIVRAVREIVSALRELVRVVREIVSAVRELVSAVREIVSTLREIVRSLRELRDGVPETGDAVPEPVRSVPEAVERLPEVGNGVPDLSMVFRRLKKWFRNAVVRLSRAGRESPSGTLAWGRKWGRAASPTGVPLPKIRERPGGQSEIQPLLLSPLCVKQKRLAIHPLVPKARSYFPPHQGCERTCRSRMIGPRRGS
jgi:uncharacterized protein YoxC